MHHRDDHDLGPDRSELEASAKELALIVERHYERFLDSVEALDSPQAQMVIFTLAAKRLARYGTGLTPLLKQVFRAFGLNAEQIEIDDAVTGETLARQAPGLRGIPVRHQKPSRDAVPMRVPTSLRRDH
jgi:hypothetical protein